MTQCTTTGSQIWREFGWKNLTRFFITPQIKSRQLKTQQPCWRLCGNQEGNHSHVFWCCCKLRPFWNVVNTTVNNILDYDIPNNCVVMYLGKIDEAVQKEDRYLVKILLIASKKAITRNWYKVETPNREQWFEIIQGIHSMEKLTCQLKLKGHIFDKNWRKWTTYRESDTNE